MLLIRPENIIKAIDGLRAGLTVVFPTETSYGLGCDATNQEAVDKVFAIKKRSKDKPLLVVVPNIEMAKRYLVWNDLLERIAEDYWPGAVTVVAEYKNYSPLGPELADGVVSSDGTLALRVINHPIPSSLAKTLNRPLVATSANIAEGGDMYDADRIQELFAGELVQPDIIMNMGKLPKRMPSTIISVVGGRLKLIRQGEVKIK